jgi:hypothetical protein
VSKPGFAPKLVAIKETQRLASGLASAVGTGASNALLESVVYGVTPNRQKSSEKSVESIDFLLRGD